VKFIITINIFLNYLLICLKAVSSGKMLQAEVDQRVQSMGNKKGAAEEDSGRTNKQEERRKKATGGKGGGGTQVQLLH
jgi:hypothetical protein